MNRRKLLHELGLFAATSLGSLHALGQALPRQRRKMPVLFIGHGSPMNAIVQNESSAHWQRLGREIPRPEAVLCISAHWLTRGTFVTAVEKPRTIHDFAGFPGELFAVQYPAPGDPRLAAEIGRQVTRARVVPDRGWGLDHGTWMVLRHMYPAADVPVLQLSIDYDEPAEHHYRLASELSALRARGVLVIGSGNMVHNLGMIAWDRSSARSYGYDWALELDATFRKHILAGNHAALIDYRALGAAASKAIPTPDHYYPLMYTLGLQAAGEDVQIFNDRVVAGSLSMTSVRIG